MFKKEFPPVTVVDKDVSEFSRLFHTDDDIQKYTNCKIKFCTTKVVAEGDLIYFGARYYDPSIGKFITRDPLGMVDGPNLYFYCNNDPINWIDLWGWCRRPSSKPPVKEPPKDRPKHGNKKGDPPMPRSAGDEGNPPEIDDWGRGKRGTWNSPDHPGWGSPPGWPPEKGD